MHRVSAIVKYGVKTPYDQLDDWQRKAHPYTVTLRYQRRQLTVAFFMGPAHTREPTAQDVLYCLLTDSYASDETFESWASDYGYNPDSRKAERVYQACKRNTAGLRRLLGDDFEAFQQLDEDQLKGRCRS